MSHEDSDAFCRRFQNELFQQKYTAINSPGWLYMAMFKAGRLSSKLVAVAPTPYVRTIESPSIIYDAFKNWSKPILGNSGTAILLFVTYRPSIGDVEEILKLVHHNASFKSYKRSRI